MTPIISRIEAASGGERELDAEILRQTGGSDIRWVGNGDGVWRNMTIYTVNYERNPLPREVPRYTTSIDAAMTLLSETDASTAIFWRLGNDGEGGDPSLFKAQVLVCTGFTSKTFTAVAATPALALCAAALKARSA